MLDLERGEFFVCRGTGPRVWELLATGHDFENIVDVVALRYRKRKENVEADVEAFVSELLEKGLIVEDVT